MGSLARKSSQWLWCDASGQAILVGGSPAIFALDSALTGDYSATRTGAVVQRVVGGIAAVPTVAAAASPNTQSVLTVGWTMTNFNTPVASLDPSATPGRKLRWMHQENWIDPYQVAPVNVAGGAFDLCGYRPLDIRVKRKYRDDEDELMIVLGSSFVNQTWSVMWHLRVLIRVP